MKCYDSPIYDDVFRSRDKYERADRLNSYDDCGRSRNCCRRDCGDICINNSPIIEIYNNGSGSEPGSERPVLSGFLEVLGGTQTVASGGNFIFDVDSAEIVGDIFTIDPSGETITINQPGLYHVEWNVNLSPDCTNAIIGIIENGEGASGAATSRCGNFASGTLIQVETVPFTITLHNYGGPVEVVDGRGFLDSAVSIRILKFADGAGS